MAFRFSDRHVEEFRMRGAVIFRAILPPTLVADLRRETDRARELARERQGAQTQRLQPIARYELDWRPFQDFAELPELRDAISRVLSPRHTFGTEYLLGVLLEPAELPYCTYWHRDWRDNTRVDRATWERDFLDPNLFNQLNCALYEDDSTWIVPGSHLRLDLPREVERFPTRPIPGPELEGRSAEERERICLEYCESMPGAERLRLNAGDFALYRNTLWHLGCYVPYRRRATLHDVVDTPEFQEWREEALQARADA